METFSDRMGPPWENTAANNPGMLARPSRETTEARASRSSNATLASVVSFVFPVSLPRERHTYRHRPRQARDRSTADQPAAVQPLPFGDRTQMGQVPSLLFRESHRTGPRWRTAADEGTFSRDASQLPAPHVLPPYTQAGTRVDCRRILVVCRDFD